jgi:ElaB/YqjD/DUF883 family membrane-anchored ribosome-binding protein
MATVVRTGEIRDTFNQQCTWPTLASMEKAARTARRAATAARNATEDFVAGTALDVRRHPLASIGLAATVGVMAGAALGVAGAWFWRTRA